MSKLLIIGRFHDDGMKLIEEVRKTWQFYRDRRPDLYGDLARDR